MIKLIAYKSYHDVVSGFCNITYYNDNEYKTLIEDILKSNYAAFNIVKVKEMTQSWH